MDSVFASARRVGIERYDFPAATARAMQISDPALDVADSSTDPEVRKENYSKALRMIADQAYWVPMFSYNTNYVHTKDVAYTPTADEVLRFTTMSWN